LLFIYYSLFRFLTARFSAFFAIFAAAADKMLHFLTFAVDIYDKNYTFYHHHHHYYYYYYYYYYYMYY